MDDEILKAVKAEMTNQAEGIMEAMAVLAILIYASGGITKSDLVKLAQKAAAEPSINERASQFLRGMCTRLERAESILPAEEPRQKH